MLFSGQMSPSVRTNGVTHGWLGNSSNSVKDSFLRQKTFMHLSASPELKTALMNLTKDYSVSISFISIYLTKYSVYISLHNIYQQLSSKLFCINFTIQHLLAFILQSILYTFHYITYITILLNIMFLHRWEDFSQNQFTFIFHRPYI